MKKFYFLIITFCFFLDWCQPTNAYAKNLKDSAIISVSPVIDSQKITPSTSSSVSCTATVSISADYCTNPGKVILHANITNGVSYIWNTGGIKDTIVVDVANDYSVTATNNSGCVGTAVMKVGQELVSNGNFDAGNTSFSTGYVYVPPPGTSSSLYPEGDYAVDSNAHNYHSNFWGKGHENTGTTGNFMILNGYPSSSSTIIWQETVNVNPNTDYYFSAWAMSLNAVSPYARLQFVVNGVNVGTIDTLVAGPTNAMQAAANNYWTRFYSNPIWTSGPGTTTATIKIINLNPALSGNDFGLDDISFATLSPFVTGPVVPGTDNQVTCINTAILHITYKVGSGLSGPLVTGLPHGVGYTFDGLTVDISGTPDIAGTFNFTVAITGSCAYKSATGTIKVNSLGTWTGATSTNWNTANNWTCPVAVPTASTDVIIPSGLSNYPTIGVATIGYSRNISLQNSASLTVTGGTLRLAGAISNSGGTINVSGGAVEMTGSSSQTIPANAFQNNSLKDLIISNASAGGVNLGGTLNLNGSLSFGNVNSETFSTGGFLTLKSSATGTASVSDLTNNNVNSGNQVLGDVTVERYISAAKKWRFLSIPTNTTQTIQAAWQEGCGANQNCVANYGTQITGPGGVGAGFDLYTATPSMKTYNSITNSYTTVPNTNTALINNPSNNTVAYFLFVRGDRSATTFASPASSTILRTKGVIKQGNQSLISISSPATAFTAVGNPYPSRLDLRKMTPSPTTSTKVYTWDPIATIGSAYGLGAYQTLTYNGTNFTVTPGGGSYGAPYSENPNYIENGEAFFVGGKASAYNITFKENIKATGNNLVFFAQGRPQSLEANLYINNNGITSLMDGIRADIGSNFSNDLDDDDAYKIENSTENVSLKRNGKLLSVERHNIIGIKDTFFLNLGNVRVQNYEWQLEMDNLDQPGLTGFIEDNYMQTSKPLDLDGITNVDFNIENIPGSYAADRFMIVFSQLEGTLRVTFTSVKAYRQQSNVNVEWKVNNESNIKQYEVEKSTDGNQFKSIELIAANNNKGGSSSYIITDTNPVEGYNYYRIKSVDINGATVRTNVVKVLISKIGQEVTVYPNPVINGKINLVLNSQPAGKYNIRIFNKSGRLIKESELQHKEGNSTEIIQLGNYTPHGIYQLEVLLPDGSRKNINVIN
jgi:hypothetical protein